MKAIEERAKKFADKMRSSAYSPSCGIFGTGDFEPMEYLSDEEYDAYYDGYIQGAEEQRKIDTEKVYHALEKILSKEMLDSIRKILEE